VLGHCAVPQPIPNGDFGIFCGEIVSDSNFDANFQSRRTLSILLVSRPSSLSKLTEADTRFLVTMIDETLS